MEEEELLSEPEFVDPDDIAQLITFDNSHLVARSLYLEDPIAARALREELSYWCKDD